MESDFEEDHACLCRGRTVVKFDIVIDTPKGRLYAIRFKRSGVPEVNMPEVNMAKGDLTKSKTITMNIKKAHALLGHASEAITRKTAETLGWTLTRGD